MLQTEQARVTTTGLDLSNYKSVVFKFYSHETYLTFKYFLGGEHYYSGA